MSLLRVSALALAVAALSGTALGATETITCKTLGGDAAYKLEIDWSAETATISAGHGGALKKLFTGATVVRNAPNDPALLAEGAAGNYAGNFKGQCGAFIERLNFDLHGAGGKRAGTVLRETVWATAKGAGKACAPKLPTPEPLTSLDEVICQ